ncbi:hypothetical protein CVIRNUC_007338 [Coccomyxa viridis]|uniref:Uncharacterized protein n=1 Tax=Coccomyxa viridis TaxID=1274662 RepID=A0AAV1ICA8_9CHLO|nr:hypothetical protein CVIRNUC_007338 [Coccomyxa viridis]
MAFFLPQNAKSEEHLSVSSPLLRFVLESWYTAMATYVHARTMPCFAAGPAARPSHRSVSSTSAPCSTRIDRRGALGTILSTGLLLAAPAALAKDLGAAARAKEERRAALAKAAGDMKNTGKAESAFEDSGYAVGEDHSPNSHTRQEEGARTSK